MKTDNKMITRHTDWTKYYEQPKSFFSSFTQQFTLRKLITIIKNEFAQDNIEVLEFGGGNSCFAQELLDKLNIKTYAIIDNNDLSIEKAKERYSEMDCYLADARDEGCKELIGKKYDFVYSVGLIEHFRGVDIKKIIDNHFACVKEGGIVAISFPTPTLKYRMTRKAMEILGCWQFYDEYPLRWCDVKQYFNENGIVLEHTVNRKLFLTQMMVVVRKN